MGKQVFIAGGLPTQPGAESGHVDLQKQEVVLATEVPRCRLPHLRFGREMNVAIGKVDGCAAEDAVQLRRAPERPWTDLVDEARHRRAR